MLLPQRYVDLHTHSSASDGTDTPEMLVKKAAELGLSALAITDHDTVSGIDDAIAAGVKYGVDVLGGCEIAVKSDFGELHLLGYMAAPDNQTLLRILATQRERRLMRNLEIIERLNRIGFGISYNEVLNFARGHVCGRPHIACALVAAGAVTSISDAFARYLGEGGRVYVPRVLDSPREGIEKLLSAGTLPVFAHPFLSRKIDRKGLGKLLSIFKEFGLAGVEAFHSKHSPEHTGQVIELAGKYELCVSGGSDYHGTNKPDVFLGYARDCRKMEYSLLENLRQAYHDRQ